MKYDFYITGPIGEEFDWWTGQRGTNADQLRAFLKQKSNQEVTIAVSSPGGYLHQGIEMMELIADHGKCNMVIIGMTASAATVLCMKAKTVKIARGSFMLIHNSSAYIFSGGQSNKQKIDAYIERLKATRKDLDTFDKAMADVYSLRNHKTIEENMKKMDEEKWMSAQDAVDFGIVDAILDDDETKKQAKAIQNVYSSFDGIEEHFQLPSFPKFEKAEEKIPRGIMARIRDFLNGFAASDDDGNTKSDIVTTADHSDENAGAATEPTAASAKSRLEELDGFYSLIENANAKDDHQLPTFKNMILKILCAVLGIQDIALADGNATLSEAQLTSIEAALADRDKKLADLTKAQADLQKKFDDLTKAKADLQKEFDDFKNEAGDDSSQHAKAEPEAVSSADLYDQVKDLL